MVHHRAGQPEAAEDACRKSLAIKVQLRDVAGQARTLNLLGLLYNDILGRPEEAVTFFRRAVDKSVEGSDVAQEGAIRSNLSDSLRRLHRLGEARQEARRAIECSEPFGPAAEPWRTWPPHPIIAISFPSSVLSRPSSAAAATARWPRPRICTT